MYNDSSKGILFQFFLGDIEKKESFGNLDEGIIYNFSVEILQF